jgi:hypothetical protein
VAIGGVCCCQSKTFGAVWRKTSARQISATPFTTKTSSAKVNASAAARNGCVCGGTFTSTFLRPSRSCAIKADCIRISSELEGLFITGIAKKSEARVRMHRLQPCLCLFTNTVSSPPSWQTPRRSDPRTIAEITSNNVGRPRRDETVAKDNGRSTAIYLRGLKDHGGDGASGSARRIISDKFFFDGRSGSIDVAQADALLMAESLRSRQPNRFRVRLLLKTCKNSRESSPFSHFSIPDSACEISCQPIDLTSTTCNSYLPSFNHQ